MYFIPVQKLPALGVVVLLERVHQLLLEVVLWQCATEILRLCALLQGRLTARLRRHTAQHVVDAVHGRHRHQSDGTSAPLGLRGLVVSAHCHSNVWLSSLAAFHGHIRCLRGLGGGLGHAALGGGWCRAALSVQVRISFCLHGLRLLRHELLEALPALRRVLLGVTKASGASGCAAVLDLPVQRDVYAAWSSCLYHRLWVPWFSNHTFEYLHVPTLLLWLSPDRPAAVHATVCPDEVFVAGQALTEPHSKCPPRVELWELAGLGRIAIVHDFAELRHLPVVGPTTS